MHVRTVCLHHMGHDGRCMQQDPLVLSFVLIAHAQVTTEHALPLLVVCKTACTSGWLPTTAHCVPCTFPRRAGQYQAAKETLLKLEDTKGLIALNVEEQRWEDAFLLLHAHPGIVVMNVGLLTTAVVCQVQFSG